MLKKLSRRFLFNLHENSFNTGEYVVDDRIEEIELFGKFLVVDSCMSPPEISSESNFGDDAFASVLEKLVECVGCNMLFVCWIFAVDVCECERDAEAQFAAGFQDAVNFLHECFHVFQMLDDGHGENVID